MRKRLRSIFRLQEPCLRPWRWQLPHRLQLILTHEFSGILNITREEGKEVREERKGRETKRRNGKEQQCKKHLTSTHYVTRVMLDMTYSPSINPHKMPWGSMVFIFILQIHKVRLSYVKTFADIVTARNWQSQDLNLDLFIFSLNYPACHL